MLLALVVFLNGWGTVPTDIKPEVYLAPGRMLGRYLSAWTSSPYLGSPNFNVGLAPVLAVMAGLRALGLPAGAAYKVLHLALWVVGAGGAARLLRLLLPRAGWVAPLVAAVVFLANPYTVTAGATLAIALPLCLLPWQLVCLVRGLQQPRSWMWPAAFGLTFFAMSGMNVGVVPVFQLLAVPAVVWALRTPYALGWRDATRVVLRCAFFVVLLSCYWLVPAVSAVATGSSIVGASESFSGIASVSSFPEVLRGLGQWSLYGRDADGPWVPQFTAYLLDPFVVVLTLLLPATALVALGYAPGRLIRVTAPLLVLAAVVMVGLYPVSAPSPFGRLLRWLFEDVTALSAFRTTNKVGSVLVVALALLLGWGAVALVGRLGDRPALLGLLAPLAFVVLVAWSLPAVSGRLYISHIDVPRYWHQAAAALDARSHASRVLLLPGQTRSSYSWSEPRPDDVTNSLLDRDAVIPETTPNTSAAGANLLAALDDSLQSGTAPAASLSTFARYLGAGDVLVRHDVRFEEYGGARPALTERVARLDPGLTGLESFGGPGENVVTPELQAPDPAERNLPPLQLYGVRDARPTVRAEPVAGSLVVDGDGWALPAMRRAGLLGQDPGFRYVSDLSPAQLASSLGPDHRVVVTDTNARRDTISNRLVGGQGPLLPAATPLGTTRTLGTDPGLQTVLRTEGIQAAATQEGGAFFDVPYSSPENAIDRDPASSWLFGDFKRGVGARLTLTLPHPRQLGRVAITQEQVGSVRIGQVTVRAGSTSRTVTLPATGRAVVNLQQVVSDRLEVRIDSEVGDGFNLVGISDVAIGGAASQAQSIRVARAPLGVVRAAAAMDARQRARLDRTPLDVLLTRSQGSASPSDDPEIGLDRDFSLPDRRTFRLRAQLKVPTGSERLYDRLVGYSGRVTATSSSQFGNDPRNRASGALDDRPSTAWVPDSDLPGASIEVRGPRRDVSLVTVVQRAGHRSARVRSNDVATAVSVRVDGRRIGTFPLTTGRSYLFLQGKVGQPVLGRSVRLTLTRSRGSAAQPPPRFTTVDTGVQMLERRRPAYVCPPVALLDGRAVRLQPAHPAALEAAYGSATLWRSCSRTTLAAGPHTLRSAGGLVLDSLDLLDAGVRPSARTTSAPPLDVRTDGRTTVATTSGSATGPYTLITGQGYDARWTATMDGTDLGPPQVLDGYSTGWVINTPGRHTFRIAFGPQHRADVALLVSGAGLLLAVAALGLGLVARRRRPVPGLVAPEGPPAPAPDRSPRRHAWAGGAIAWVAGATVFLGVVGLVAAGLLMALDRWRRVPPRALTWTGAALVLASGLVFVLAEGSLRGQVSAAVVSSHLLPHYLAGVGLLVGAVGAARCLRDEERESRQ
ncbi:MAG: alpha-(1-_3)-arabinofuranosyltransferase family protein [Nocardioidaceae bacterium]